MSIEVNAQDVTDAETFLEEYLSDKIETGDYTDGSALRDLVVKAISFNFAYLRKTATQIRVRQSLKTIEEIDTSDDPEAADDAVDEILSNWFAKRNQGGYVRVTAYGHASQPVDVTVASTVRFYKTAELVFLLDNNGDDLFVPAEQLVAIFDSSGAISDYIFPIPLIAELPGRDYEVAPGVFASFDSFNAYVTRVETLVKASGGEDIEASEDYIARAQNLITVRNLINARSVDATLREDFEDIKGITTIGMADNEMIRDRVREAATGLELHVGGHMDMFLFVNTVETSFSAVVGARFTRPDGIINVFRDATYADYDPISNPGGHKFTDPDSITLDTLLPGMALRIHEGLPIQPHDYIIREVRDTELVVSERVPFPVATDETSTYVTWSVGYFAPDYEDIVAQQLTGETSKQMQTPGRVTLPGGPLYLVKDVTINDPSDPDSEADDGLVHLNVRVNTTPTEQVAPDNQYQVLVNNPEAHQSKISFTEIVVGPDTDPTKYDGKTLKVTYDTLVGFDAVNSFVTDRRRRVSTANQLVRGYHPAYLSFTLEYRLLSTATTTIDEDALIDYIVGYVNNFNPRETMGVNQIMDAVRVEFPNIGRIYPFTIYYDVHVPDGRVIEFESDEEVTVPWVVADLRAVLVDPDSPTDGFLNPADYGVSDDVIRYLTTRDAIQVAQRT
jgi:hypothetical protein